MVKSCMSTPSSYAHETGFNMKMDPGKQSGGRQGKIFSKEILISISLEKLFRNFSSVQFSHSAVSDSLRTHESQHARPPCPSPTPGVHPDSRPLSQCCHPAISSSVVPFSSCPQSLPASESFPMSQLFA